MQSPCPNTPGEHIRVEGRVLDGAGVSVPDAVIEIWQANSVGRYHHPADIPGPGLDNGFTGFARSETDEVGRFFFQTVKPGPVPFDGERMQAPHISVTVLARGLLNHLMTRIYFQDEATNAADPILALVPTERRATLLARRDGDEEAVYRFEIVLQGDGETVFFNPTGRLT